MEKIIVLDVEMTGLDRADEITQVSIIDGEGNVLLNRYYKPRIHVKWEEATKLTGITPELVENCPHFDECADEVTRIVADADLVVGYNIPVDLGKLRQFGCDIPEDKPVSDVMKDFAPIYGDWNEAYGEYRYKSLSVCSQYYGYEFKAHDSLEDVRATLFCYYKVKEHYETHLTEKQKANMPQICYYRYEMQDMGAALFNPFSPDHEKARSILDTAQGANPILALIREAGLPEWDWQCDIRSCPADDEAFEHAPFTYGKKTYPADPDYEDPVYEEKRKAGRKACDRLLESFLRSLAAYIWDVNERYGTEYY